MGDRFNKSPRVPATAKQRPRVISAAYIGVTLDEVGIEVVGFQAQGFGSSYSVAVPAGRAREVAQSLLQSFAPQV